MAYDAKQNGMKFQGAWLDMMVRKMEEKHSGAESAIQERLTEFALITGHREGSSTQTLEWFDRFAPKEVPRGQTPKTQWLARDRTAGSTVLPANATVSRAHLHGWPVTIVFSQIAIRAIYEGKAGTLDYLTVSRLRGRATQLTL